MEEGGLQRALFFSGGSPKGQDLKDRRDLKDCKDLKDRKDLKDCRDLKDCKDEGVSCGPGVVVVLQSLWSSQSL